MSADRTTRHAGHQRMHTNYFYAGENTLDSIMFTYHRARYLSYTVATVSFSSYFATRRAVFHKRNTLIAVAILQFKRLPII